MNPIKLIDKYYDPGSRTHEILLIHSEQVMRKALELAERVRHLNPDLTFVQEAAMLHDMGIFLTYAPDIGCYGEHPYILHGPLGRDLLEKEGLPKHALVCERHTGVGLSRKEIKRQNLLLPKRDMLPISIEEKIICLADCFYGKNPDKLGKEKSIEKIEKKARAFGGENPKRLAEFRKLFRV